MNNGLKLPSSGDRSIVGLVGKRSKSPRGMVDRKRTRGGRGGENHPRKVVPQQKSNWKLVAVFFLSPFPYCYPLPPLLIGLVVYRKFYEFCMICEVGNGFAAIQAKGSLLSCLGVGEKVIFFPIFTQHKTQCVTKRSTILCTRFCMFLLSELRTNPLKQDKQYQLVVIAQRQEGQK